MSSDDDLWNALEPAVVALQADKTAMADPHAFSAAAKRVAETLAIMLEYDQTVYGSQLRKAAKWLLEKCGGDLEGLLETLDEKGKDRQWLQWVIGNDVSIYASRLQILDAYARRQVQRGKAQARREELKRLSDMAWEKFCKGEVYHGTTNQC